MVDCYAYNPMNGSVYVSYYQMRGGEGDDIQLYLEDGLNETGVFLLESLGVIDRNGVEIFEGDIVSYKGHVNEVRWAQHLTGWVITKNGRKLLKPNQEAWRIMKVMGNIFQHRGLLE